MILLLKNHKVKRIEKDKFTQKDLKKCEYLLCDTSVYASNQSKNYVMVPTKDIPWFTKADVRYQMLYLYDNSDEGFRECEPIPDVATTVYTIEDLINLLNCIDRLYVLNQMISNDMYLYTIGLVVIGYFEVTLYNGNKKTYHKIYQNKETFGDEGSYGKEIIFPLKVLKKFKEIYNTDFLCKLIAKNMFLYIYKDMTWGIANISKESYLLIGVPLLGSRTVTFLNDIEFLSINSIFTMTVSYSIVFINNKKEREYINNLLKHGEYDTVSEYNYDYILISNLEYGGKCNEPYPMVYLDIFSHLEFSIRLTNMLYYYIEGFVDGNPFDCDGVDTIVSIIISDKMHRHNKSKYKIIFMNEATFIPLDNLLKLLIKNQK